MKTAFIVLVSFLNSSTILSQVTQQWAHSYKGPLELGAAFYDMALDTNSNTYLTGRYYNATGQPIMNTVKYSSNGDLIWEKDYQTPGVVYGYGKAIAVDFNGNTYITGQCLPTSDFDYNWITIKYDSTGQQQWVREIDTATPYASSDSPNDIALDGDGNIYVTGTVDPWINVSGFRDNADFCTVKYSPEGDLLWKSTFTEGAETGDEARFIAIDSYANVYVIGRTYWYIKIIKYNTNGVELWNKTWKETSPYHGVILKSSARAIYLDREGNLYLAGYRQRFIYNVGYKTDFLLLKYDSGGNEKWLKTGPDAMLNAIAVDDSGNVLVTGFNENGNNLTMCYNSTGTLKWERINGGLSTNLGEGRAIALGNDTSVYVAGYYSAYILNFDINGLTQWIYQNLGSPDKILTDDEENLYICNYAEAYIAKYSQSQIYNPWLFDKWLAGETDPTKLKSIKWYDTGWPIINIYCILDYGTNQERNYRIAQNSTANSDFVWKIPDELFSYQSKIMIENAADPSQKIYSEIFRIKPYHLTYVGADSLYYPYSKILDQWGFWNSESDMWPPEWWAQFDYNGIDPFTGINYPIWQGFSYFPLSHGYDFPDWVSWVNTFGINACYHYVNGGIYSEQAVLEWFLTTKFWNGSCFGIATANALVFNSRGVFFNSYNSFPSFIDPITVTSSDNVRKIINELWTHQFGNPHFNIWNNIGLKKTPVQTVEELKTMLFEDDISSIRALSMMNNSGSGGHTILPYKLRSDDLHPEIYYIFNYDNSYPNSSNPIIVNTEQNFGKGSWNALNWPGWGGYKWLALEDKALSYLDNPTLPKNNKYISPFILSDDIIKIIPSNVDEILISDNQGNTAGYVNDNVVLDIPESTPIIIKNGTAMPPLGYWLPANSYSISTQNFLSDTIGIYLSSGNKAFYYSKHNVFAENNDEIFFDGGVTVPNFGTVLKSFDLKNIINETIQEKVFNIRNINLAPNDSIKIHNPDDNQLIVKNFGSAKDYEIELNFVTQTGLSRFLNSSISLSENSTQQLVPNWGDFADLQLTIYLDVGNDGTVDDTLKIVNQITEIGEGQGLLVPSEYRLEHNYPNPFNPSTKISWQSPVSGWQTLKVYDILGNEVATLVNEEKPAGGYEVEFDAGNLPSGVYFYQLKVREFIDTKKMLLLK